MTAVVSTSYTRLDPPLKPTASARAVLAFVTSDPFLPPCPLTCGRYATEHAHSPGSPTNSYSCSPVAQSQTRAVPSTEQVAICTQNRDASFSNCHKNSNTNQLTSSRSGDGSNAADVTAPACERSSVRYAWLGMSRTPRLPVLVDAHTCRPSELTEHDVTCEQNTTSY